MSIFGEYECSLSGVNAPAGAYEEEDGLEDLPLAWTQITMQRRTLNPEWVILQQIKEATKQQLMSQIPEDQHKAQEPFINFQLRISFDQIEEKTPRYILDVDDVLHLAPEKAVSEVLNELRESLGLEPAPEPEVFESEDEDEDEDE